MGNQLLAGKKGIIFGALDQNSIAWKVAERCHEEGAEFILTNAPIALRMGVINELAENQKIALVLAKIDHKSYGEIAELMQLSTKAVESLVARAKQNLKNSLEKGRTNRVKKSNE